ncbi:DUF4180 domain-containing protein [Caulobacter segnis]|uniref:DUF4180 domain-containing protein n=1 Tax=Caulobacter segnis TaxID=88688 RepID=UPI00240FC876|nr:DUF4180 domain-containing protein [Caulobacter segnis]MDG2523460.1 DUF4180 domain-containing protein [Caulobacter segnis]
MEDHSTTLGETRVLVFSPHGPLLAAESDANDFISAAWSHEAEWLVIPTARLGPDFLRLSTRIAGLVIQKFVNYRLNVAIVGDISTEIAGSDALRDFVHESNLGPSVWFVPDLAALERGLAVRA